MRLTNKAQAIKDFYQEFIYYRTYSRWNYEAGRRENWDETVDRFRDFWLRNFKLPRDVEEDFHKAIALVRAREIMPSMRLLWTAGKAVENDNICAYNCSYIIMNKPRKFAEMLYILMNGTGVGVSVERQFINQLPEVPNDIKEVDRVIVFEDSKYGWADGLNRFIYGLYNGCLFQYDVSKIRPRGSILKTFGGRASGAEPLFDLLKFITKIFYKARGRKLNSEEIADICCKIAEIVVVGGVRRCLFVDEPVATKKGIKKIKDVEVGNIIVSGGEEGTVIAKEFVNRNKYCKIIHKYGEHICSLDHRWFVWEDFNKIVLKKASELKEGDFLVWDAFGYEGSNKICLPQDYDLSSHFNSKTIEIPSYLNDEIAWLIGFIHADGHVGERGIEITTNSYDKHLLEYCNEIFWNNFKVKGKISKGHGDCCRLRIHSKNLKKWFAKYIKRPNENINIPDFIFKATKEIRGAYLAGLFDGDGRLRKDKGIEQTTTEYEGYANQIRLLLSSLGIACSFYKRKKYVTINIPMFTNKKNWWRFVGSKCMSKKIKKFCLDDLENGKTRKDLCFPYKMVRQLDVVKNRGYKQNGNVTLRSLSYPEIGLFPIKIEKVEIFDKNIEMVDIEVSNIHRFTTGGILSHNSAIIILANPSDLRMRNYKKGQFWITNPQRTMANISLIYDEKPKMDMFLDVWKELINGQMGEPGIVNRKGFFKTMLEQGRIVEMPKRKDDEIAGVGTNPCGEIILKPNQFCNLTTVILKRDEKHSLNEMMTKVRFATLLGTLQLMLTDFKFIEEDWKRNCEEERLLGVSLTGLADVGYLPANILKKLKVTAKTYNALYAEKLSINRAKAVTCIKPSGTVSQMILGSSGLHSAYAPYYIRRVRISTTDPLCQLLIDLGIPNKPEVGQSEFDCNTRVFEFPIHHEAEVYRYQMNAIKQLEEWKKLKLHYCDHNPSCTIYVKDHEWLAVGDWIYQNWDIVGGLSFLPLDDAVYPLAPYEEIDHKTFEKLVKDFPDVRIYDFQKLAEYEKEDYTTGAKKFECEGNSCRI